jgi:hypothetical protein
MCSSWLTSKVAMYVMIKKFSILIKLENILHTWKCVCLLGLDSDDSYN